MQSLEFRGFQTGIEPVFEEQKDYNLLRMTMNDLLDAVGMLLDGMRFFGLFIYFPIWWIQNLWSKLLSFNQHRAKMFGENFVGF